MHPRRREGVDLRAIEFTKASPHATPPRRGHAPGGGFGRGGGGMLADPMLEGGMWGNPGGAGIPFVGMANQRYGAHPNGGGAAAAAPTADEDDHVGTECAISKQSPINGRMFRRIGNAAYAVCEAAFDELPVEEQRLYELVEWPVSTVQQRAPAVCSVRNSSVQCVYQQGVPVPAGCTSNSRV